MIWLVAFAVPAQGMAAVTMMHCGPGHHGAQAAQTDVQPLPDASQASVGYSSHGHASHPDLDANTASDTVHHATSPDASAAAQADETIDPVKVAKAASQKCSACASCCSGLALPSTAVIPPTIDGAREVTVLSLPEAASVVIDGPERPPRILHA